ncbi:MAG: hypothetical protein ABW168_29250 [Sedimenticola sp.]
MDKKELLKESSPIEYKELKIASSMNKTLLFEFFYVDEDRYAINITDENKSISYVLVVNFTKEPRLFRTVETGISLLQSVNPELKNININLNHKEDICIDHT